MKKIVSLLTLVLVSISLILSSVPTNAYAATKLKDGKYKVETKKDEGGMIYKLNITIKDGKLKSGKFAAYNGSTEMSRIMLPFVSKANKAGMKDMLDKIDNINKQLKDKKDGSKVTGASDNFYFTTYKTLWGKVVKQAKE